MKCVVKNCRHHKNDYPRGVSFHKFPESLAERKLWLKAIGQPNLQIDYKARICSAHFDEKYLIKVGDKYSITRQAIPIKIPPSNEQENSEDSESEELIVPERQRIESAPTKGSTYIETEDLTEDLDSSPEDSFSEPAIPICCIPSCPSNKQSTGVVRLFTVPDDSNRKAIWANILSNENVKFVKGSRICYRHFDEKYIVKGGSYIGQDGVEREYQNMNWRLTEDAVPSATLIEHSVKEKVVLPRLAEKKFKVEKTCRTCSIEIEDEKDVTPLFTGSLSLQKFRPDIFKELEDFSLKIAENDGLPQQICQKCLQSFSILIQFRKQCQRVQIDLVKYFKDSKNQQRMRSSDAGVITLCDNYSDDEESPKISRNSIIVKKADDAFEKDDDMDDDDLTMDDDVILSDNEENVSDDEICSESWTCEYYIGADEKVPAQKKKTLKRKANALELDTPKHKDKSAPKVLSIITHHTPVQYTFEQGDTIKQRKRCKLCQRLTSHCCKNCPEETRLCLEPCFAAFHESSKNMPTQILKNK